MTLLIGGLAVEPPAQPTTLSQDEAERAQVWLEKCCEALWRFDAIDKRLRKRELWVSRNHKHPLWEERKQQVWQDTWDWHHAWTAFHEATERLDGVLHRWPEAQQRAWMAEQGIGGATVLVRENAQVIENTGWAGCRLFRDGPPPF